MPSLSIKTSVVSELCMLVMIISLYTSDGLDEVFSSQAHTGLLLKSEQYIVKNLEEYLEAEEERIASLRKHIQVLKVDHDKAIANISLLLNPVNSYLLIRRLSYDLEIIEQVAEAVKYARPENLVLPTQVDLAGAALGIERLRDTYDLDVKSFKGDGGYSSTGFASLDYFAVGHFLISQSDYYKSTLWLKEAVAEYKPENYDNKLFLEDILKDLCVSFIELGDNKEYKKCLTTAEDLKVNESTINYIETYKKNYDESNMNMYKMNHHTESGSFDGYKSLCKGEERISKNIRKRLTCRYFNEGPFLKLAPMKMELLHLDPELMLFHQAINDYEIMHIKYLSMRYLKRSRIGYTAEKETDRISKSATVYENFTDITMQLSHRITDMASVNYYPTVVEVANYGIGGHFGLHPDYFWLVRSKIVDENNEIGPYRVSKSASLYENETEITLRLANRSADMAAVNYHPRFFEVANYGIGGYYITHADYFVRENDPNFPLMEKHVDGDRLVTVLFYLSSVRAGGATVFPKLGLRVQPVRGTALVWRNLHASGAGDRRTEHASCPVLHGDKWIMTRWIHQVGQELRFPCPLDSGPHPQTEIPDDQCMEDF